MAHDDKSSLAGTAINPTNPAPTKQPKKERQSNARLIERFGGGKSTRGHRGKKGEAFRGNRFLASRNPHATKISDKKRSQSEFRFEKEGNVIISDINTPIVTQSGKVTPQNLNAEIARNRFADLKQDLFDNAHRAGVDRGVPFTELETLIHVANRLDIGRRFTKNKEGLSEAERVTGLTTVIDEGFLAVANAETFVLGVANALGGPNTEKTAQIQTGGKNAVKRATGNIATAQVSNTLLAEQGGLRRRIANNLRGRKSTILTSPLGVLPTEENLLLGSG